MLQRYVTTGPLTRRAEDLLPVLRILAGPDGIEERCIEPRISTEPVDLRKLTAYVVRDNGVFSVEKPMLDALDRASRALGALCSWLTPSVAHARSRAAPNSGPSKSSRPLTRDHSARTSSGVRKLVV